MCLREKQRKEEKFVKNYFSRLMSSAKKWEFIVWWIFRLIMIGAMVSLLFTNPPSDLPKRRWRFSCLQISSECSLGR